MTNPLNPGLYEHLQRRFGEVRVSRPGERRRVERRPPNRQQ